MAARGREAGAALGPDPTAAVRDLAARVLAQLQTASDEVLVSTPVGGMRLIDYLPSRVFELAVHTLDIAAALPVAVTLPETAAAVALHLLADRAVQPGKAASLLLAGTGRHALPAGFNVLLRDHLGARSISLWLSPDTPGFARSLTGLPGCTLTACVSKLYLSAPSRRARRKLHPPGLWVELDTYLP